MIYRPLGGSETIPKRNIDEASSNCGDFPIRSKKCLVDNNLINLRTSFVTHTSRFADISLLRSYDQKFSDDTVCFYDNYEFDGQGFGIPCKFNIDTQKFTCWGNFCSLECAKAFIHESHDIKKDHQFSLLATMSRKVYGRNTRIERAPSKYILKKYGGPLDITEFRENFSSNKLWVVNRINCGFTYLVYDVYLNQNEVEVVHKPAKKCRAGSSKNEGNTDLILERSSKNDGNTDLILERTRGPCRLPKTSILHMVGKYQKDEGDYVGS